MYASGEVAMAGDIVEGSGGLADVLEVTPSGIGGEETATIHWRSSQEKIPGSGIWERPAPISVPTRSLRLVSRNSAKKGS